MLTVEHGVTAHVTGFCRTLRERGMYPGPSDAADALRAMSSVDMMVPGSVYWALRSVLVSAREEIPVFDDAFALFWDPAPPPTRETRDSAADLPGKARTRRQVRSGADGGEETDLVSRLARTIASTSERNQRPDLLARSSGRTGRVQRIAARVAEVLTERPSRRLRLSHRRGQVHMRKLLRRSLSGGEYLTLPRRKPTPRRPQVLMLIDASGSMDRHVPLVLEFCWSLSQHIHRSESFAFSTNVSNIGPALRSPTYEGALARIEDAVHHWSGGTMIGDSIAQIRREHPEAFSGRTTVILVSDGWDTGDPEHLARELRKVRSRVRRIVWLNPLIGTEGYELKTRSLVAAATHVDCFAPIGSLAQLRKLPEMLARRSERQVMRRACA